MLDSDEDVVNWRLRTSRAFWDRAGNVLFGQHSEDHRRPAAAAAAAVVVCEPAAGLSNRIFAVAL